MKKIVLFILSLVPLMVISQNSDNSYSVRGKIGSYNPPAKIYLQYTSNDRLVTHSSDIIDGVFNFSGQSDEPANARLVIIEDGREINDYSEYENAFPLILINENIEINSSSILPEAIITGSPTNNEADKLTQITMPVINKMIGLANDFRQSTEAQKQDEDYVKPFQKRYDVLQEELNYAYITFIKANPSSVVSLLAISELLQQMDNANTIDALLKGLSPDIQRSSMAQKLIPLIEEKKITSIGSIAPDFMQKDPNGNVVRLSDFKGKYLLVDFWASWCRPCRQENPALVKAYEQFKDKNFEILGVSLDNPNGKQAWLNAIEKDQLTWPQVSDLNGWQNAVALQYKVFTIPQNFLLDPEGRIIAKNLRGEELVEKLKETVKN